MTSCSLVRRCSAVTVAVIFLSPCVLLAQGCDRKAVMTSAADVYERPARYATGLGWQGNRIAALSANTKVYICSQQSVDFGFFSKVWFQIAYRLDGQWRYGWVLEDTIKEWHGWLRGQEVEGFRSWIAPALAAETPGAVGQEQGKWNLPPAPPPRGDVGLPSSPVEPGAATWHDLWVLYAPLFLAMLFGMIAKAVVDYLDAPGSKHALREHSRNALVAVLVSPIVFLGFLTAGQFSVSTQTFIVLWLLAFQNGFFWQTVLKREGERKSASDQRQ